MTSKTEYFDHNGKPFWSKIQREQAKLRADAGIKRFVVYCWETVAAYAHEKAPDAVCEVLAATAESAQDAVRQASCGHYEAFETHVPGTSGLAREQRYGGHREGMTFEEFRNWHLERIK